MDIAGDLTPGEGNNNDLATCRETNVKEGDDSPFQPWLPSIPQKEQSLHSYQDMGMCLFFYHTHGYSSPVKISSFPPVA
jgi:hypothetical protein